MNERIKLLAGQAKFMAEETINRQISKNAELDAFAEKFAELIVRECADIADIKRDNTVGCGYITKTKGQQIREHFGVEE